MPEQYHKIATRSQRPNLRNKKNTGRRIQTFLIRPKKHANQDNLPKEQSEEQ